MRLRLHSQICGGGREGRTHLISRAGLFLLHSLFVSSTFFSLVPGCIFDFLFPFWSLVRGILGVGFWLSSLGWLFWNTIARWSAVFTGTFSCSGSARRIGNIGTGYHHGMALDFSLVPWVEYTLGAHEGQHGRQPLLESSVIQHDGHGICGFRFFFSSFVFSLFGTHRSLLGLVHLHRQEQSLE